MAKHKKIAQEIQRLIHRKELRAGDLLPSERAMAKRFGVSYNTLRGATDLLAREGIIERQHGRGTYVARPISSGKGASRHHRLGLLYVDLPQPLHAYSQSLTFEIQRTAHQSGYELVVDQMRTEDLIQGKVPEIIRRRSVDAILLDGRPRESHIRFLQEQQMLYLVMGNTSLGEEVPQVRVNREKLAYEMTRELLLAGRNPVWMDVDISLAEQWHVLVEIYRGYVSAMKEFSTDSGALYLCPVNPNTMTQIARQMGDKGLGNAAFIAHQWAAAMLPPLLEMQYGTAAAREMLIVTTPFKELTESIQGSNVVGWSSTLRTEEIAQQSIAGLLDLMEGTTDRLHSLSMDFSCTLRKRETEGYCMNLEWEWLPFRSFAVNRTGNRQSWKPIHSAGFEVGKSRK